MELSSDTTNLYRSNQVDEAREELRQMEAVLSAPPHVRGKVSDPRSMQKRFKRVKDDLEKYTPRAYLATEKDAAVREFEGLIGSIKAGMPSSEEMRRNAPGCVEKHRAWESRNKRTIARMKHIGLRLEAGGDVPAHIHIPGASINIEAIRSLKTSRDLSMDGAQIPKTADIHIGSDPAGTVVFTAADEAALMELAPALAGTLATMNNEQRAQVKDLLNLARSGDKTTKPATDEPGRLPEYNVMKKMAAEHGMEGVHRAKKMDLIGWLRAHKLIR